MAKPDITAERLKELFYYSPDTGYFWKIGNENKHPSHHPLSRIVGGITKTHGYVLIRAERCYYFAHRLAWVYMTGEFPKYQIDHINGIRHDNRWRNLRDVTGRINSQNSRKSRANSSSGMLGAQKNGNNWSVRINTQTGRQYLGTFKSSALAHEAYVKAKRLIHEGCTI